MISPRGAKAIASIALILAATACGPSTPTSPRTTTTTTTTTTMVTTTTPTSTTTTATTAPPTTATPAAVVPNPQVPAPQPPAPQPPAPQPPAPQPPAAGGVTPGAFCSPEGARGTGKSNGLSYVCTRNAGEDRARWRQG